MDERQETKDAECEVVRLRDEVEQLRTALETSADEVAHLIEERDRLLQRITTQARDLQTAETADATATSGHPHDSAFSVSAHLHSASEQEELRVAFEEMQVLTEELEVANTSLHETNRALDQRVQERTVELERRNAELADSELRFRTLAEGIPQLVWRAVDSGSWTWASPQWAAFTGQEVSQSRGFGWLQPIHPEDRAMVQAAWARAPSAMELQVNHRLRRAKDGAYCWFQTRATPVLDARGEIVEWLGASTDVQDMRALQDRQRVLLHELQHRVRNILAVVRSIASSTGETSDSVDHFTAHLEGRVNALARTQMVLTRAPGAGVDLQNMVRQELLAQAAAESLIEVSGPDVRLSPKAAEVLTLAVHELATNAVKYGALGGSAGRVKVGWSTFRQDGDTWLSLVWQESGVRMAATAPRRQGFGTELIQSRAPYELRGRGEFRFLPGGIHCEISFPLRAGESILQTDAPEAQEDLA